MGRWLILQSDGSHKGGHGTFSPNWYLRECYGFQYALRKMGHDADIIGPGHATTVVLSAYDYILVLENYGTEWLPQLNDVPATKIQWIVDAHCQNWDVYRAISAQCDIILHATRSLMDAYAASFPDKRHVWFPCCIDERYFNGLHRKKTENVVFVGSRHPNREAFLQEMEKRIGLKCMFATGQDMIEAIASANIHFNMPISVDINARVFETIGIGTCLLTSYDPALVDMGFEDMKNVALYRTPDEAFVKFMELMECGKAEEIGRSGFDLSRRHTIRQRLTDLLSGFNERI